MLTESVVFLVVEWRLRRRTNWRQGALDHLTAGVVAGPVVLFLLAALVFSTGGWDLLRPSGVLTVFALPVALGAGFRAVRGGRRHRARAGDEDEPPSVLWRWQPTILALGLSVVGLVVVSTGAVGG